MQVQVGTSLFEVVADFFKIPEGISLGAAHAIVEDRAGRLYLYHHNAPSMLVFDGEGCFLESWGSMYAGGAHGCFIREEDGGDFLYLSNTDLGLVTKNRLNGEELWRITTPRREDLYRGVKEDWSNKRFVPTQAAVATDGRIYIVDGYGEPYCHVYTQEEGQPVYAFSFGGAGDDPGCLAEPHGLEIGTYNGQTVVFIANRRKYRVDAFSLEGEFLATVIGPDDLRFPCGVELFEDWILVPDLLGRLSIFTVGGKLLAHWGDPLNGAENVHDPVAFSQSCDAVKGWPGVPAARRQLGVLYAPHDTHVIRNGALRGSILVSEWLPKTPENVGETYGAEGRVTLYKKIS